MIDNISGGELIAMVIEADDAVNRVRKLCGPTMPSADDKDTLRGLFNRDSLLASVRERRGLNNIVHSSGNLAEARQELGLWFPDYRPSPAK